MRSHRRRVSSTSIMTGVHVTKGEEMPSWREVMWRHTGRTPVWNRSRDGSVYAQTKDCWQPPETRRRHRTESPWANTLTLDFHFLEKREWINFCCFGSWKCMISLLAAPGNEYNSTQWQWVSVNWAFLYKSGRIVFFFLPGVAYNCAPVSPTSHLKGCR